jgi:azurin
MQTNIRRVIVFAATLATAACDNKPSGGGEPPAPTPVPTPTATATAVPAATSAAAAAAAPTKVDIELSSVGNEMKYDKAAITVPAGALVHLTLKNTSTMDTMPHNFVVVKTGTEAKVALDGLMKAPDAGYVVPGPDVYANSPLALPGKTIEYTFTAPPPGKYPYICTVPGHYLLMKGVLTTTEVAP